MRKKLRSQRTAFYPGIVPRIMKILLQKSNIDRYQVRMGEPRPWPLINESEICTLVS